MIPRSISVMDAASYFHVLPCTIRAWIHSGRLSATKIGKQYYIPEPEVEKLLAVDKPGINDKSDNNMRAKLVSEFVDQVRIKATAMQIWDDRRQRNNRRRALLARCTECR